MSVSFVNDDKVFGTKALLDHGRQFALLLNTITNFLALPREAQTLATLHFVITQNKMLLSKISAAVIITAYQSRRQRFELSRAYSTPARNVTPPAKVFELNQICDRFNNICHIHFLLAAGGKIGAHSDLNTFAVTHPVEKNTRNHKSTVWCEIQNRIDISWEYETSRNPSESTFNYDSTTTNQMFTMFQDNSTQKHFLSKLVKKEDLFFQMKAMIPEEFFRKLAT